MIYFMEIVTRLINFNELRSKNYGNNIKYVINKSKHIANIYAYKDNVKKYDNTCMCTCTGRLYYQKYHCF